MAKPIIYRKEVLSGVTFGPFDPKEYYDIENSKDVQISKGYTLKSVECVVIRDDKLLFIEAKKTAPKELSSQGKLNQLEGMIDSTQLANYKELISSLSIVPSYIADVCEKFVVSLCLVLSIAEGRIASTSMPETMIKKIPKLSQPVFVLVVTLSKPDWICNVQDAFTIALRKFEKTNHAKVVVLTAQQARDIGLVSKYVQRPKNFVTT